MEDTTIPEGTPTETGDTSELLNIIDEDMGDTKDHSQGPKLNTSAEVKEDSSKGETETTSPSAQEDDSTVGIKEVKADETKTEEKTESAPAPEFDKDLGDWAVKRGYAKEGEQLSERELKIAQDARNNQRQFSKTREAEKQSETIRKALDELVPPAPETTETEADPYEEVDPVLAKLNAIEAERAQEKADMARERYLTDEGITDAELSEMMDMLKESKTKGDLESVDYYSKRTDQWLALAKARLASKTDHTEVEQRVAQKERERLVNIQKAQGPSMSAQSTATASSETSNEDMDIILGGLK